MGRSQVVDLRSQLPVDDPARRKDGRDRSKDDRKVSQKRHPSDVVEIVFDAIAEPQRLPPPNLREPRDARSHSQPPQLLRCVPIVIGDEERSGPDDAHLTTEDVDEARELIEATRTKKATKLRETLLVRKWRTLCIGRITHRPELQHLELRPKPP